MSDKLKIVVEGKLRFQFVEDEKDFGPHRKEMFCFTTAEGKEIDIQQSYNVGDKKLIADKLQDKKKYRITLEEIE